jgi:glucosamine--fructose-6-phosphate aminotransferase (isomerizing)
MKQEPMMWREILEEPAALRRCIAANRETAEKLARETAQRGVRQIVIAARGTSDHAAIYGKYVLELLTGIPVSLAAPSVLTMYHKKVDYSGALVIGISQSGATQDVTDLLTDARAQGALTVGISNTEDSPMLLAAEERLLCAAGPEISVAATKTFTTELACLLMLACAIGNHPEVAAELDRVPEALEATFAGADALDAAAERFIGMQNCFTLARGTHYAVAMESALKIQETTYIPAKAFAISDFYHGPVAMVERDTPVILYGMKGPSLEEADGLLDRLEGRGAAVLAVSNDPALCARGALSYLVPCEGSDFVTPFCTAAVAQMLACKLALARGNDPDRPRGLHKITG